MSSNPIDLGSRKHVFIDLALVEHAEGIALAVNPPRVGGVAIARDRPWEHHLHFQTTVIDEGDRARMWYTSSVMGAGNLKSLGRFGYAESVDGRTWHKPDLGLVALNGRTDNNLIPPKPKRANVFLDPTAPPEHRYKTFGLNLEPEIGAIGYGTFGSSDGLTFRELGCNGLRRAGDTQNMAFWDARLRRYVAYFRGFSVREDGSLRRAVARWETDDLNSRDGWDLDDELNDRQIVTQLTIVIACDDDDPDDMDIYTPSVVRYPGAEDVYLATLSMYHHFTPDEMDDVDPPRNDGLMDVQLAVSRDGVTWSRPDRRPYVGVDASGPASRMIYSAQGLVMRGDRVLQYHTAYDQSHGHKRDNNPGGQIRWTEQRLDGFVSVDAAYAGGELLTKSFTFDGDRLELNIDASASGEARVEIQDAEGHPLEGHRLSDCDRVMGNYLRRTVSWGGNPQIAASRGSPIRLRVAMRGTKLYALKFNGAGA